MQKSLLQHLICPINKDDLQLQIFELFTESSAPKDEIKSGVLISNSNYLYPIVEGVPCMLPNSFLLYEDVLSKNLPNYESLKSNLQTKYSAVIAAYEKSNKITMRSFSAEWGMFNYGQDKTWDADANGMIARFLKEIDEPNLAPTNSERVMLDAGCGNGLLDKLIAPYFKNIIAVDFSNSIFNAFKSCNTANVFYVQGDIQNLPFKENTFDLIQCSGVLVTLKDQQKGFNYLQSLLKQNGKLSIWLYHARKNIIHNAFNKIRNITCKMPWTVQKIIYNFVLLPPSFIIKKLKGNPQNLREMKIDIYDWFAPEYRWETTHEEALAWYSSAFKNAKVSTVEEFGFNAVGIKS